MFLISVSQVSHEEKRGPLKKIKTLRTLRVLFDKAKRSQDDILATSLISVDNILYSLI